MKNYFVHLLKKNLLPLACLTLFCVVVYVVPISVESYYHWNHDFTPFIHPEEFYSFCTPILYIDNISIALAVMSILIPIYLFSYKMNRRSVDLHYSLPLGKTKILVANFLVGLILLYAPYSVAYLWGFVTAAVKIERLYLINYLYLYFASLLPAFITYSITAFIYTRANTIVDGIICVAGVMCMLVMVVATVDKLGKITLFYTRGFDFEDFFPFVPLVKATEVFQKSIWHGEPSSYQTWFTSVDNYRYHEDMCELVSSILWTLIATASTIGLILSEKHAKAENCGQISDSIFCYKVQIPAYTFMLAVTIVASTLEPVPMCAIALGAYVACVIYKRTFKIGWKLPVVLGSCFVGEIILYLIIYIIG